MSLADVAELEVTQATKPEVPRVPVRPPFQPRSEQIAIQYPPRINADTGLSEDRMSVEEVIKKQQAALSKMRELLMSEAKTKIFGSKTL